MCIAILPNGIGANFHVGTSLVLCKTKGENQTSNFESFSKRSCFVLLLRKFSTLIRFFNYAPMDLVNLAFRNTYLQGPSFTAAP